MALQAKKSPLQILRLGSIEKGFHLDLNDKNAYEVTSLFSEYDIEVEIDQAESKDGQFLSTIKIEVNKGHSLPGYYIFFVGFGEFKINEDFEGGPEHRWNLKMYSSFGILLSHIRSSIQALTSDGFIGSYSLPSIDMPNLFEQKAELEKSKVTKKSVDE